MAAAVSAAAAVAIAPGAKVYLDANVLIYMTEGTEERKASLAVYVAAYEAAGAEFVTSELAITEVMVHPLRANDRSLVSAYERLLTEWVQTFPVSRHVLGFAAKLRADSTAFRTPDAIHVATACAPGAAVFVTGSKGIKGLPVGLALHLL
jgi:predicted nucleic acid-binding protein